MDNFQDNFPPPSDKDINPISGQISPSRAYIFKIVPLSLISRGSDLNIDPQCSISRGFHTRVLLPKHPPEKIRTCMRPLSYLSGMGGGGGYACTYSAISLPITSLIRLSCVAVRLPYSSLTRSGSGCSVGCGPGS